MENNEHLLHRITVDPKIMVGKPIIRGTRLTVEYILNLLANGASSGEILGEYSDLHEIDILACLQFATKSLQETTFMPLVVGSH